jgi:predicted transcriptional regulator
MSPDPRICFGHRRIRQIADLTDIVAGLFPGNRNQQHAAGCILLTLRQSNDPRPLNDLEEQHGISRRTVQRVRAKLAQLGLIEHVSWMNRQHGGRTGWVLSGRMAAGLRLLADKLDAWRSDKRLETATKEWTLVGLLRSK